MSSDLTEYVAVSSDRSDASSNYSSEYRASPFNVLTVTTNGKMEANGLFAAVGGQSNSARKAVVWWGTDNNVYVRACSGSCDNPANWAPAASLGNVPGLRSLSITSGSSSSSPMMIVWSSNNGIYTMICPGPSNQCKTAADWGGTPRQIKSTSQFMNINGMSDDYEHVVVGCKLSPYYFTGSNGEAYPTGYSSNQFDIKTNSLGWGASGKLFEIRNSTLGNNGLYYVSNVNMGNEKILTLQTMSGGAVSLAKETNLQFALYSWSQWNTNMQGTGGYFNSGVGGSVYNDFRTYKTLDASWVSDYYLVARGATQTGVYYIDQIVDTANGIMLVRNLDGTVPTFTTEVATWAIVSASTGDVVMDYCKFGSNDCTVPSNWVRDVTVMDRSCDIAKNYSTYRSDQAMVYAKNGEYYNKMYFYGTSFVTMCWWNYNCETSGFTAKTDVGPYSGGGKTGLGVYANYGGANYFWMPSTNNDFYAVVSAFMNSSWAGHDKQDYQFVYIDRLNYATDSPIMLRSSANPPDLYYIFKSGSKLYLMQCRYNCLNPESWKYGTISDNPDMIRFHPAAQAPAFISSADDKLYILEGNSNGTIILHIGGVLKEGY